MVNKWIADRGYGTGMSLAFQGDEEFVRRSLNFAANFLLSSKAQARELSPNFVLVNTTMDELVDALQREGYAMKMRELYAARPRVRLEAEDFPDTFEDDVNKFIRATLSGDTSVKDPTARIMDDETEEMREEATTYGIEYAKTEIGKLEFDAYMRQMSTAPVVCHAVSDNVEKHS